MFVHFGNQYYGKVDVVPNLCYVATRFFHVNFVPLLPLESCIIVHGTEKGNNFQGIKTALSIKSVLMAWLRAALYLLIAGCCAGAAVILLEHLDGRDAPLSAAGAVGVLGIGLAFALWLTYRLNRAGYDRALQLGTELGLDPTLVEQYVTAAGEKSVEPAKEPEGWERYS